MEFQEIDRKKSLLKELEIPALFLCLLHQGLLLAIPFLILSPNKEENNNGKIQKRKPQNNKERERGDSNSNKTKS